MNFLTQIDNLALIALLVVSGAALFLPTLSTLISGKGLSPTEATIWINRRKAYVLDLRAEDVYKTGHLPGAKLANAASIAASISFSMRYRIPFTQSNCGSKRAWIL